MRVVVVGAGLGGLGAALRLQGSGHEVVVVEQRPQPGGRAYRIRDGGYTWDTGPSLITMPWVLEETFAAGGLDLHEEVTLRRLDPFFRIRWAGDDRHLDFGGEASRMREEIAKFSARDAGRYEDFIAALRPIYERGILDAGRRPFGSRDLAAFLPTMLRLRAYIPLWRFVSRFFEHPRVREAFAFQSLFIGGDPFRVPAVYAGLIYLQTLDGVWYSDGGVYSLVEAMVRPLDVRCGQRVERIEHRAGRITGVLLAGGERLPADAVVYNGDVLHAPALLGRRPPRRRLRPTLSCFLLYLGTDAPPPGLEHHTVLSGAGFRRNIKDVTRRGRIPQTCSTYVHAPGRTEPAMAPPGGDSLAVLMPVPNLGAGIDWSRESDRLRDAIVDDLDRTFGLAGLRDSIRVEHRMTPEDFRDRLGAFQGNAFSTEPTLHQSAAFRTANRDRGLGGMYYVGGGTHPGAGIPGVLLGAEITARLVQADAAPAGGPRRTRERERAAAAA